MPGGVICLDEDDTDVEPDVEPDGAPSTFEADVDFSTWQAAMLQIHEKFGYTQPVVTHRFSIFLRPSTAAWNDLHLDSIPYSIKLWKNNLCELFDKLNQDKVHKDERNNVRPFEKQLKYILKILK